MQTKIPMTFKTTSRYYDLETSEMFDEIVSSAKGCLLIKDGCTRLLYREKEEGSEIFTEISFENKDTLSLKKSGDAKYELCFKVNEKHEFLYYAPPLSFDGEIFTHVLKNSVCIAGGSITVEYSMNMGGHKQKVYVRIDAEADVKL